MTNHDSDYHERCFSWAQMKESEHERWDLYFDEKHPNYPGSKYLRCELAANHDGICEHWMESVNPPDGTKDVFWIQWNYSENPTKAYKWHRANTCPAVSNNEYLCSRPVNHIGGHCFNDDGS